MRHKLLTLVCSLVISASCGSAVARVKSGTGFFVSSDGYLVTSAHLVAGCPTLATWTKDGKQRDTQVVAINRKLDIALLRLVGVLPQPVPAAYLSGEVPIGDEVHAVGYGVIASNPKKEVQTTGIYIGTATIANGIEVKIIRAQLRQGESGGPVIGSTGVLLGMVIGRFADAPDHGVVLPSARIDTFLQAHGLSGRQPVPMDQGRQPHELLAAATALIQCLPRAILAN